MLRKIRRNSLRRKSERLSRKIRRNENVSDERNLIYDFILENELCTEGELDMACDVGGFNTETLNYVIYRQTAYHDIEQLWDCERETFYFNDDILEYYGLTDEDEDFDESRKLRRIARK